MKITPKCGTLFVKIGFNDNVDTIEIAEIEVHEKYTNLLQIKISIEIGAISANNGTKKHVE